MRCGKKSSCPNPQNRPGPAPISEGWIARHRTGDFKSTFHGQSRKIPIPRIGKWPYDDFPCRDHSMALPHSSKETCLVYLIGGFGEWCMLSTHGPCTLTIARSPVWIFQTQRHIHINNANRMPR